MMDLLSQAGINVPQNVYTVDAALDAVKALFEQKGGVSR